LYSRWLRNSFIYLLILVAVIAIVFAFFNGGDEHQKVAFGQVIQDAKSGIVEKIDVDGRDLTVTYKDRVNNKPVVKSAKIGPNTDLEKLLLDQNVALAGPTTPGQSSVALEYKDSSGFGPWLGLLLNILPFLLFGLFLLLIMRQAQGSNSQAMSFGKSRARLFTGNKVTVTFGDVAGVDEAKEELAEVVEFLKYPEKFAALGARIPKGVLLVGPLACRSLASQALNSSRCSSALAQAAFATSSIRPRRTLPALSSSTKSTRSAASVALALGAATTSVSRR
jgi:cell division protease FtsH